MFTPDELNDLYDRYPVEAQRLALAQARVDAARKQFAACDLEDIDQAGRVCKETTAEYAAALAALRTAMMEADAGQAAAQDPPLSAAANGPPVTLPTPAARAQQALEIRQKLDALSPRLNECIARGTSQADILPEFFALNQAHAKLTGYDTESHPRPPEVQRSR
jgi:hypothetical protein